MKMEICINESSVSKSSFLSGVLQVLICFCTVMNVFVCGERFRYDMQGG